MELILVRHGQPAWTTPDGKGRNDPGLTDLGHDQAKRAADRLADTEDLPGRGDVDRLFVSPAVRAQETAAPIAAALDKEDFAAAMATVHARMGDAEDRRAWFIAALCLAWPDGQTATFLGRVDGTVVWPPRGSRGFGYDPMFLPSGGTQTFGEMDPDAKHAVSHRARAFAQVLAACFD